MVRSSSRHKREFYGRDSSGETAPEHGELPNDQWPGLGEQGFVHDFSTGTLAEGMVHTRGSDATGIDENGMVFTKTGDEPVFIGRSTVDGVITVGGATITYAQQQITYGV